MCGCVSLCPADVEEEAPPHRASRRSARVTEGVPINNTLSRSRPRARRSFPCHQDRQTGSVPTYQSPTRHPIPCSRTPDHRRGGCPRPPRSLVRGGQTRPRRPRLVVSLSTCPSFSPFPPAHSFVPGPPVINIISDGGKVGNALAGSCPEQGVCGAPAGGPP